MSKQDSSSETDSGGEVVVVDAEDATPSGDESTAVGEPVDEAAEESRAEPVTSAKTTESALPKPRRSWFSLFNFLLILCLAGGAGYYWWMQQQAARDYHETIADLRQQLADRASNSHLDASLDPLKTDLGKLDARLGELDQRQQGLHDSTAKLYELYGRDKNDWQLAEVEYLMRVAQHKLILQDDFEGAAVTLQAASDKIALTGDPGLLPVRLKISEEIADLKTRKRADLVGMTLILAQLSRQVRVLNPGFAPRIDEPAAPPPTGAEPDMVDQFNTFINSLVEVRHEGAKPSDIEAGIADVGQNLEDNLKLARWAVLERDATQYDRLIDQSLRLTREFYDLDNAANHDFLNQLQDLQKMQLKPEKPDITGSLRELQRILSQRENAPKETGDG